MANPRPSLDTAVLDTLFHEARTHNVWLERPVEDALLHQLYALTRMGPTSSNTQPLRLVFVKSPEAKQRLKPALAAGNVDKTMSAPVTAIVAYDSRFHEQMPKLFPSRDLKSGFQAMPEEKLHKLAYMNSTLQGGYLILAARALGLDCGPMAGFDNAKVDETFFPDGQWKSNFLLNLGYGDPSKLFPRNPRLDFNDACRIE
ncbi:malonic semialdehyde reductase [Melittangium boletus]|uniref:Putative NADH dehydrogenase/NAD(P)H nitroreductase MEBOL_004573 n=1 Tax=Melittangium boletus DSM 14713 TaxID=1294270 RepID=A0A250IIW5_9BACT|nr:malonic semialdehyde reductase [Melittangium boletus]ATB31111.1 nitroreductase family protein [Melittangium boletus DSM 14713]